MKCQFDNCDNEANKCVKRKIVKGQVTKKTFHYCENHSEEDVKKQVECQCISLELQNPMCQVKNLIKKN